jgi:hypothetical protein
MTDAQRAWMAANPGFEPITRKNYMTSWADQGVLHKDGEFVRYSKGTSPVMTHGCICVGRKR